MKKDISAWMSPSYLLSVFLLALVYFAAAKFGLSLATIHPSATAVWASTGIAAAAFLLFGRKFWPGVFFGAFFANLTTEGTLLTSLGIAFGNTMEGLFAALLVNKYAGGKDFLREPKTIMRFAILAGIFSTLISATVGPGILLWKGFIEPELFFQVLATWWLGDAVGALVVTPFLIAWVTPFVDTVKREESAKKTESREEESEPEEPWRKRKILEAFLMFVVIVIVTRIIFGGVFTIGREGFSLSFIAMALLIWPALRFNTKITAFAAFLLAATAAYGMLHPFQMSFLGDTTETSFLVLQVFSGFSAISALMVASLVETKRATDKKLVESYETLAVEEQYFRMLAETVPQIVWSADRFGNYNYINKFWFEYTGRNSKDPKNTVEWSEEEWVAVIHPADYAEEKKRWHNSLAEGVGHEMGYRLRREDGMYRWHFARIVPVKDRLGKVVYWVGTMVDVDKHKRAEEYQRQLVEKVKEEDVRKNTFLAVLSHELRNPLAAITLSLDLLEMTQREKKDQRDGNGEFESLIQTAREQFARVTRIVDDLLQVSRIMHRKFELQREKTSLEGVIQNAVQIAMPLIAERRHSFELALPDEPTLLLADTMRLEQALVNLLQNAAKYTPNGGRISLRAEKEDHTALITITDNGIGIDSGMIEHIFEPFTQGPQKIARGKSGLGVGLMLAKTIIEAHGGTIRAESDGKDKGSQFIIRLPLA